MAIVSTKKARRAQRVTTDSDLNLSAFLCVHCDPIFFKPDICKPDKVGLVIICRVQIKGKYD